MTHKMFGMADFALEHGVLGDGADVGEILYDDDGVFALEPVGASDFFASENGRDTVGFDFMEDPNMVFEDRSMKRKPAQPGMALRSNKYRPLERTLGDVETFEVETLEMVGQDLIRKVAERHAEAKSKPSAKLLTSRFGIPVYIRKKHAAESQQAMAA